MHNIEVQQHEIDRILNEVIEHEIVEAAVAKFDGLGYRDGLTDALRAAILLAIHETARECRRAVTGPQQITGNHALNVRDAFPDAFEDLD